MGTLYIVYNVVLIIKNNISDPWSITILFEVGTEHVEEVEAEIVEGGNEEAGAEVEDIQDSGYEQSDDGDDKVVNEDQFDLETYTFCLRDNERQEEDESKYKGNDDIGHRRSSTDEEDSDQEEEEGEHQVQTILSNPLEFRPEVDMKDPQFQNGLVFPLAATFKAAVRQYAIKPGKDIFFKKNDPTRI